jgi:hypothetical protein
MFPQSGCRTFDSLVGIYPALFIQFNNAAAALVFAAAPYGTIGALIALAVMHTPFGFMAFLGVASLIGVIVSHVIVLFDFIEEMHEKGEPLERALPDAGIERIRPVMITVGATILALFPLALEGGPLWKPLCYAQIGGLAVATFITLLLVPVFYAIFVLDLKWIAWDVTSEVPALRVSNPLRSGRFLLVAHSGDGTQIRIFSHVSGTSGKGRRDFLYPLEKPVPAARIITPPHQCNTRSEYSGCLVTYCCTVGQIISTLRLCSRAQ